VPVASVTSSVTEWVTGAIGSHGVYAVFLLMALDAVFPAASELVMLYAGALAAGAFSEHVVLFGQEIPYGFWAYLVMALSGTLGYTVGALAGWAIGYYGGRPLLDRHGHWLHLSRDRLARAEAWFEKRGRLAVLLGRITPIVRSFISIPAGLFRQPLVLYTVLTVIGSAIWCFTLAGVGWAIGSRWEEFHEDFRYVDIAALALVVLALAYLVVRRRRSSTLARRASDSPD
jgi:membrane protein DedA with SNARE-associated domain